MSRRKVAVVGMGGTFPTCSNLEEFESKLFGNKTLIREWPEASAYGKKLRSHVSGYVTPEESGIEPVYSSMLEYYVEYYRDLSGNIPTENLATSDLPSIWSMQGADQAVKMAGWSIDEVSSEQTAVILGSAGGGNAILRPGWHAFFENNKKSRLLGSHNVDRAMTYREAANVSCFLKTKGMCEGLGSACATGLGSIGYAYRMIANGYQERAITGAAEGTSLESFLGFDAMSVLSRGFAPEKSSRPFAADRGGFVCSFGSGIVCLENLELAEARGAPILGVIEGYHNNADGDGDMFSPSFDGQRRLWQGLFADAGSDAKPDVVKAHGTSTPTGDGLELNSIVSVLGSKDYLVSAPKSQFGHMLGAAGSVEFVVALLMLKRNEASPCQNSEILSEELEAFQTSPEWSGPKEPIAAYRDILPTHATPTQIERIACLNYGFGGTNAAIMIKRYE
ncbi:MAG: beta-ketoacyl-[acyl-carrier-protein] synthase family protein [Opitutales bacterium]